LENDLFALWEKLERICNWDKTFFEQQKNSHFKIQIDGQKIKTFLIVLIAVNLMDWKAIEIVRSNQEKNGSVLRGIFAIVLMEIFSQAKAIIEMGFLLGIGGAWPHVKNGRLNKVIPENRARSSSL